VGGLLRKPVGAPLGPCSNVQCRNRVNQRDDSRPKGQLCISKKAPAFGYSVSDEERDHAGSYVHAEAHVPRQVEFWARIERRRGLIWACHLFPQGFFRPLLQAVKSRDLGAVKTEVHRSPGGLAPHAVGVDVGCGTVAPVDGVVAGRHPSDRNRRGISRCAPTFRTRRGWPAPRRSRSNRQP
jgi:hypothetical protein